MLDDAQLDDRIEEVKGVTPDVTPLMWDFFKTKLFALSARDGYVHETRGHTANASETFKTTNVRVIIVSSEKVHETLVNNNTM